MYSINFTKENTKFYLSLRYNGANSYFFVNGKEFHKFTAEYSEIIPCEHVNWSVDNMKKTQLKGCVYCFSVDYDSISVADITDIHKYSIEKNKIVV